MFRNAITTLTSERQAIAQAPVDKEGSVHTLHLYNDGDTAAVTLELYRAEDGGRDRFREVTLDTGEDYRGPVVNLGPGDRVEAHADGGDVRALVSLYIDSDSGASAVLNPRSEYDPEATYNRLDLVPHQGSLFIANEDGIQGVEPRRDADEWALASAGMHHAGEWEDDRSYGLMAVVKHQGSTYVAPEGADPGDEPGAASTWKMVAEKADITTQASEIPNDSEVDGDTVAEALANASAPRVRRPEILSPADGDEEVVPSVTIEGSELAVLYSVDERDYRRVIAIYDGGDWDDPDHEWSEDADSIEVMLPIDTQLHLRIQDVLTDGTRSEMSETVSLHTADSYVEAPSISSPSEDETGVAIRPTIETDAFSVANHPDGDTHIASRFYVRRASDQESSTSPAA